MDDEQETEPFDNEEEGYSRPIGKLCLALFQEAIEAGATEIQIRPVVEPPAEPQMRLRLRVNGELIPGTMVLPWPHYHHLISRFKKMSQMDVAVRHSPQSGKMGFKFGEKVIYMTLQMQPIHDYESCVIYFDKKKS